MRKQFNYCVLSASLALILLGLSGCAFSAFDRPHVDTSQPLPTRTLDLPPSEAFKAATAAAQNLGYKIAVSDPQRGLIRTDIKEFPLDGNANCGTWNGMQLVGYVAAVLIIEVKEVEPGKSVVTLDCRMGGFFQGRNGMGMVTREEAYRCASFGWVESNYLMRLSALAADWPNSGAQAVAHARQSRDGILDADPFKKLETMNALGLLSPQEYAERKAKLPIKETGEGVR